MSAPKKYLTVKVTKQDIWNGVPQDAHRCPIACALKAQGFKPEVGRLRVLIPGTAGLFEFGHSKASKRFVDRFDEKGAKGVKPATFRLRLAEVVR